MSEYVLALLKCKGIGSKKLYNYYKNVINSDIIDIFVIGDVNERHVKKIIEEYCILLQPQHQKVY